ncbi:MAG: outer membrane beta-barrel protein [marine benthic group bacterium]|nr:outer membrane beta-barrel protein [Gemmatimonadota bacterium]
MTAIRLHRTASIATCILSALLLSPSVGLAQRATGTLIVRVEEGGMPASGVEVGAVVRRSIQPIGTTGSTGLVAVEELRLDIQQGTRVNVTLLGCGAGQSALLVPQYESLGDLAEGCQQVPAGHFFWGQAERIVVRLEGGDAMVLDTQTDELRSLLSGWRAQVSFLFTALMGEDFDSEKDGIGADAKLFYIWESGLGAGIGGSWTTHDVIGLDENMNKWSAYVEPRYTLFIPTTKLRPYVLARASYNWFSTEGGVRLGENGWGFGGGIGAAYPVASWIAIDLGVYLGYLSVSAESTSGTTFTRSGTELQLTGGLRFF